MLVRLAILFVAFLLDRERVLSIRRHRRFSCPDDVGTLLLASFLAVVSLCPAKMRGCLWFVGCVFLLWVLFVWFLLCFFFPWKAISGALALEQLPSS